MSGHPEISQRDLRLRSKEIMDSVEGGQSFTVTRDGHQIAELIPLRRRRTFVPREEFLAGPPSSSLSTPNDSEQTSTRTSTTSSPIPTPGDVTIARGLVDTNILILRHLIPTEELPRELAISAVTLAELSAGPHLVRGDDEDARRERARRTFVLQRTEREFDALPSMPTRRESMVSCVVGSSTRVVLRDDVWPTCRSSPRLWHTDFRCSRSIRTTSSG